MDYVSIQFNQNTETNGKRQKQKTNSIKFKIPTIIDSSTFIFSKDKEFKENLINSIKIVTDNFIDEIYCQENISNSEIIHQLINSESKNYRYDDFALHESGYLYQMYQIETYFCTPLQYKLIPNADYWLSLYSYIMFPRRSVVFDMQYESERDPSMENEFDSIKDYKRRLKILKSFSSFNKTPKKRTKEWLKANVPDVSESIKNAVHSMLDSNISLPDISGYNWASGFDNMDDYEYYDCNGHSWDYLCWTNIIYEDASEANNIVESIICDFENGGGVAPFCFLVRLDDEADNFIDKRIKFFESFKIINNYFYEHCQYTE